MKLELKNPVTQIENSIYRLRSKKNQAENRIPEIKAEVDILKQIIKEHTGNMEQQKMIKLMIYRHR